METRIDKKALWAFCLGVTFMATSAALCFAQTNPVIVGVSGEYWGGSANLASYDNHVFLSVSGPGGYVHWIYNVSNPTNPIPVGPKAIWGEFITVSRKSAYVVSDPGANIYDISDPTNAVIVGQITNSGKLAVSG